MDYKGRYVDHRALAAKCRARVDVYNMAGSDWLAKHELDCASAINDLISRLEAAEAGCAALDEARENANEACAKWEGMYRMALERAEKAEITASDLCDDFTDFVTSGVYNAAPYCANCRIECVNARGWCNGDNKVCRGFMPKAAVWKEE